ncbi:MAG TPA: hypothetical protein DIW81_07675 [Planctomycetaceae bacterium]|nr:hypothetical protein [Rubinisphaera sp.]HCS51459.1 hypothetical protein [Planctomycetaceae bacterium]
MSGQYEYSDGLAMLKVTRNLSNPAFCKTSSVFNRLFINDLEDHRYDSVQEQYLRLTFCRGRHLQKVMDECMPS